MQRRIWLPLLALVGALLALSAGGTLAATLVCALDPAARCAGTAGDDELYGEPGPDRIFGLGGDDSIFASYGDDRIEGNHGDDWLHGGPGSDTVLGGPGDDEIHVDDDATADVVDCGPGSRDEVWFDRGLDTFKNCERKHPL